MLADIVEKVHDIDHPKKGDDQATGTEADIARRVGELQAATLLVAGPGPAAPAGQDAASAAGLTVPIRGEPDLQARVTKLDERDKAEDAARKRAELAGDLAAATVASLLSVPDVGSNEVVQIVREYLGGLVEESPLKDVFAAWTERRAGAPEPPDAETLVVPDPARLAAEASYTQFKAAAKDHFAVTLPSTTRESPVDAAVDLTNQARYLSEGGAGPCAGCSPVESHDDEPFHGPVEDHPVPDDPPGWVLLGGVAAVDQVVAAGDEAGGVGGEERDERGDLVRARRGGRGRACPRGTTGPSRPGSPR